MLQIIHDTFSYLNRETTSTDYLILSNDLCELLYLYYKYLLLNLEISSKKSFSYIYDLFSILDLKNEIQNIEFSSSSKFTSFYSIKDRKIFIDLGKIINFYKIGIVDKETIMLEFYTILFHEIYHAIQYKYLDNNDVMSIMKKFSILIKENTLIDLKFHDLIPDEREASIESCRLIYSFYKNANIDDKEDNSYKNILFYLVNGYATINGNKISPYNTIIQELQQEYIDYFRHLSLYKKIVYGLDVEENIDMMKLRQNQIDDLEIKKILRI